MLFDLQPETVPRKQLHSAEEKKRKREGPIEEEGEKDNAKKEATEKFESPLLAL